MVAQGEILSGRYLLNEELGSGGMGTVYRAVDLRTGADVAVKAPHPFLTRDASYMERLRREAQMAASLHSPRIALVTDYGEHEGTPYLVMEYVPGESLSEKLERTGALPPEEALHIATEVARALDVAHQRGIVHRDLKPQNIRLSEGDDVKVLDFGIARQDGQRSLTIAGTVIGSPEYIAPERAEGSGDIRADIYSLGIVLYQMLTGRVPFDGGTPWTVMRQHTTEPPPPLPAGMPSALYPLVNRMLAKRPEERYQTPRELATALQDARRSITQFGTIQVPRPGTGSLPANGGAGSQPVPLVAPTMLTPVAGDTGATAAMPPQAPAPSNTPPPVPPPKQGGLAWPVFAGVAVLVLALLGAGAWFLSRDSEPGPSGGAATAGPAVQQGTVTTPVNPAAPPTLALTFPTEGAQVTSPVRVEVKVGNAALKAPAEGDPTAQHLHYFLDADPSAVLAPGQPVPTGVQNIIHTPSIAQIVDLPPGAHAVWVVLTDNNHIPLSPPVQAQVGFTVTGTPARTGEQAPIVYQALIDGKWRLITIDGNGRNPRRLSNGNFDDIAPSWSPDGTKLAFASNRDGKFHIYTMNPDGSGLQQLTRGDFADRDPVWSPDGARLAFSSDRDGGRSQVFTMPAGGGEATQVTRGQAEGSQPSWSGDGRQLAFVRPVGNVTHIFVVDAGGGDARQLTSANQRHIDPHFSPDGRRIAFSAFRDNRWNVYVMNADGSDVRQVTNEDFNRNPCWSPDGRELVFASGREGQQQIYKLPIEGGQTRLLTEGLAHSTNPCWPRK